MHQPARVNRAERREYRQRDVDALGQRNRPEREPCREWLALEQLHRDEQLAVRLADVIQLADVGVRHARGGARFAPEALSRLRIPTRSADHLDGDLAVEALIGRGIHDAHPSFAELRHHAVVTNRFEHDEQAILYGQPAAGVRELRMSRIAAISVSEATVRMPTAECAELAEESNRRSSACSAVSLRCVS